MTDQPAEPSGPASSSPQDSPLVSERSRATSISSTPSMLPYSGLEALVVATMQIITAEEVGAVQAHMAPRPSETCC
jgi:hypothetical protein